MDKPPAPLPEFSFAPEVISIEGYKYGKSSQKRAKTCNPRAFFLISRHFEA